MKRNVGNTGTIIRVIGAILLIGAGYFFNVWWLYLIALVPLSVAVIGYCPVSFSKKSD